MYTAIELKKFDMHRRFPASWIWKLEHPKVCVRACR